MTRAALGAALALFPVLTIAEWVADAGCFKPGADHVPEIISLNHAVGRYVAVNLAPSGVPEDAVYVRLEGTTYLRRTGAGRCTAYLELEGGVTAPDAHPYTFLREREAEKRDSWVLHALPRLGVIHIRVTKEMDRPGLDCAIDVEMSVARWCR